MMKMALNEKKNEMRGYASGKDAIADGCREIDLPESFLYVKQLDDGRIFSQPLYKASGCMGNPQIIPAWQRKGPQDDGC